jgi:ferrous iron transport protein B
VKRIALLGMPNTGKSTFFNRITGASARVGNWPGVTIDLMGAKVLIGAS